MILKKRRKLENPMYENARFIMRLDGILGYCLCFGSSISSGEIYFGTLVEKLLQPITCEVRPVS